MKINDRGAIPLWPNLSEGKKIKAKMSKGAIHLIAENELDRKQLEEILGKTFKAWDYITLVTLKRIDDKGGSTLFLMEEPNPKV